ncbi:hypothetical protein SAMN05216431_11337 [Ligilactobacillus sp. WC1T17]|uniref:Transcriptional regulator n=1 Tax=Ligilactobacillus ruminis TaxID=1623 RepID=A0ABY1ADD1_9LACO|nr:hypothetical protein SAMN05216431_11337 [Ligilactobacillus ruminis]
MKVLWEKQFELRAIIENYLRQKGYSKKSLAKTLPSANMLKDTVSISDEGLKLFENSINNTSITPQS